MSIAALDIITNRLLSDMLRGNAMDPGPFHESALGAPDDLVGYEFPNLYQGHVKVHRSPLMADVPGADTSNWSSEARPNITAWEGADMDAYWLDNGTWRHCRTGEAWEGEPVNLLDATRAAGHRPTLNTVADFLCAVVASSTSLDVVNEDRGEQMEAAE